MTSSTTSDYLSHVLDTIQEAHPTLADPSTLRAVLPSLLLALIAGDTNLIISTPQPSHLQKVIGKILSTIFGLSVKRIRINSTQSPSQLLDSLFIYPTSHRLFPHYRSHSDPRPPSSNFTEHSDSTLHNTHSLIPPLPRYLRHNTDPLFLGSHDDTLPRLPQVVVISHLERAGRSAHLALAEVLALRQVVFHSNQTVLRGVWDLPDRFFTVYVAPLAAGEPTERPNIHPNLLDHFAFSATLGQLPQTARSPSPNGTSLPPSPSPTHSPVIKSALSPVFPYSDLPPAHSIYLSPLVSNYSVALISAARHHPELDGSLLTARCVKHVEHLLKASGIVFGQWNGVSEPVQVTALVMEAHVRRIVPPALAHRLRVRDSPREQIMGLLWPEAGVKSWKRKMVEDNQDASTEDSEKLPISPGSKLSSAKARAGDNRRSIKAILAEILVEV